MNTIIGTKHEPFFNSFRVAFEHVVLKEVQDQAPAFFGFKTTARDIADKLCDKGLLAKDVDGFFVPFDCKGNNR